MRELTGHKVNPANDLLQVFVMDEPGAGGAHHEYHILFPDQHEFGSQYTHQINFQNGPINEAGVNGLTHEVLIEILIDRMRSFQAGPYANGFNAAALEGLENAQTALLNRTRERMARNVEGTHAA
jgi:hypothetical protein